MKHRRQGTFELTMEFVEGHPSTAAAVLARLECVPVRVELLFDRLVFAYTAISPLFRVVAFGERVPTYRLTFKTDKAGELTGVEVTEDKW